MRVETTEVTRVLRDWLAHQRWFAGKSRASTVQARLLATLAEQPYPVHIWLADVSYSEGVEPDQVPIVLRT
ncbi:MAG: Maltokinase N-terminal cap domain, partial [Pseudonocardiales bacterium]|nr:Maltokinase N-terminal cap domain [Pseudonocardiales bacterium]